MPCIARRAPSRADRFVPRRRALQGPAFGWCAVWSPRRAPRTQSLLGAVFRGPALADQRLRLSAGEAAGAPRLRPTRWRRSSPGVPSSRAGERTPTRRARSGPPASGTPRPRGRRGAPFCRSDPLAVRPVRGAGSGPAPGPRTPRRPARREPALPWGSRSSTSAHHHPRCEPDPPSTNGLRPPAASRTPPAAPSQTHPHPAAAPQLAATRPRRRRRQARRTRSDNLSLSD